MEGISGVVLVELRKIGGGLATVAVCGAVVDDGVGELVTGIGGKGWGKAWGGEVVMVTGLGERRGSGNELLFGLTGEEGKVVKLKKMVGAREDERQGSSSIGVGEGNYVH